jgi:uncharacterized protein (DUF433 family)
MLELPSTNDIIEVNPESLEALLFFRGTRVPIRNLFDYIEGGETADNFVDGFPPVTREQAINVLKLAKNCLLRRLWLTQDQLI